MANHRNLQSIDKVPVPTIQQSSELANDVNTPITVPSILERREVRAVIKYYFLRGKKATQIKSKLDAVLGDAAPSFKTVHIWVTEFKRGRTSCEDERRSGRPNEVTTKDMVEKIHKIVEAEPKHKVRDIAERVGISTERVHNILHEHLNKDAYKLKRTPTAYKLWRNTACKQIKLDNPALKVTEVAKRAREMWRVMKDKSEWEAQAAKIKTVYLESLIDNPTVAEEGCKVATEQHATNYDFSD